MSEKDVLEEWEKNNNKNTVFYDGKASDGKTINTEFPELIPPSSNSPLGAENTKKSKGHVSYEVDYEGNLKEVAVSYNIDGRQYTVSMDIKNWGFGEDHIRLEIRRKSKNPLKNLFRNNLLASSVTPIRIKAYENGCLWTHLKNNNIQYPSDPRYKGLVDAAFADIKVMSREIEEKMDYMRHYDDRIRNMERQKNKQDLLEQNRREQAKLKDKNNKDIELINILIGDKCKKR